LWSVRLFKTRSQASEACKSGKVSMDGFAVKSSRELKIGDIIEFRKELVNMKVKVLQLTEKRMGAPLVSEFMTDLTSQEEKDRVHNLKNNGFEYRDRGLGRPTKKNRRELENLKDL
jgi:ribosome-associated heat shock protein Hsp15